MAQGTIKVRLERSGGLVAVRILIRHPMETGLRLGPEGTLVPPHHITELTAQIGGEPVMTAYWGPGVAKDPYVSFQIAAGPLGERLVIAWTDTQGDTERLEVPLP
jgi:sulfur-oxidizing protein SoxZ